MLFQCHGSDFFAKLPGRFDTCGIALVTIGVVTPGCSTKMSAIADDDHIMNHHGSMDCLASQLLATITGAADGDDPADFVPELKAVTAKEYGPVKKGFGLASHASHINGCGKNDATKVWIREFGNELLEVIILATGGAFLAFIAGDTAAKFERCQINKLNFQRLVILLGHLLCCLKALFQ